MSVSYVGVNPRIDYRQVQARAIYTRATLDKNTKDHTIVNRKKHKQSSFTIWNKNLETSSSIT